MLIDDIISYIKKCVKADTDIDSDIPIFEAYKYAHNIDPPEIQVQIINDTEHAGSYTFEGEQASRISVQITAYTRQMKLGGTMISAQRASRILGDKIKHWCAIEKINAENAEIEFEHFTPHCLRHTFATICIERGMRPKTLQKLLGHIKIDTTMHYSMVNQNNVKISYRK